MSVFSWERSPLISRHLLYRDRQQVLSQADALRAAIAEGKNLPILAASDRLIYDTIAHFVQEERTLKSINYAELERHRAQHRAMGAQLAEIRHGIERHQIQSALQLLKFYDEVLRRHMVEEDAKYHDAFFDAEQRGLSDA